MTGVEEPDEPTSLLTGSAPPPPVQRVQADHLARADRAWSARVAGATWRQVAEIVGYSSPENAIRAVRTAYGEVPSPERAELRDLWRERLEAMWRQVLRDMSDQRPGAVTAGVRVAHAAAALDGLNEPVRVDLEVTETFQRITEELLRYDL